MHFWHQGSLPVSEVHLSNNSGNSKGRPDGPHRRAHTSGTCCWHLILALANGRCQRHADISRKIVIAPPLDMGSSGDPGDRQKIAGQGRSRAGRLVDPLRHLATSRWRGDAPFRPTQPESVHTRAPHLRARAQHGKRLRIRDTHSRGLGMPQQPAASHARTHHWTGVATPVRRNTTQAPNELEGLGMCST